MPAWMANVIGKPKFSLSIGNEAVVKKLAIHKDRVASAIAFPRIRLGKISDNRTQVTGPNVAP